MSEHGRQQLIAEIRQAAEQALEQAQLAYQLVPNSYTFGAVNEVDRLMRRLDKLHPAAPQ
jgi:hypothetical protein